MARRDDRRLRMAEGMLLLGVTVLTIVVFRTPRPDLAAARLFYDPAAADRWPGAHRLPWSALYGAAPFVTAFLVLAGLALLALGTRRRKDALTRQGVFLLASVVLGPGLLVNFALKDHWGRPRPREIVEFEGTSCYAPPLVPCSAGGSSFPCGHCSVGFLGAAGWWIWRRRPAWARASLAAGIAAGFALGLGRMAAGGHFLSDVVWSGILALGVAHLLYHYVLRVPACEEAEASGAPRAARGLVAIAAVGGIGVLLALFAVPHGAALGARIPLSAEHPAVFELTARVAHVELVLVDAGPEIAIDGEMHGFGLPTSTMTTRVETIDSGAATLRFAIVQQGWFTDLDAAARVLLPVDGFRSVSVRVERGNIQVIDRTRAGVERAGSPLLDLHTGYGRVVHRPR